MAKQNDKVIAFPRQHDDHALIDALLAHVERFAEASRALDEFLLNLPREISRTSVGSVDEGEPELTLGQIADLAGNADARVKAALEPTIKAIVKRKMNR